jgi:hypothetical protein
MARVSKLMSAMRRVVPLYAFIAFVPLVILGNVQEHMLGNKNIPNWFMSSFFSIYVILISLPVVIIIIFLFYNFSRILKSFIFLVSHFVYTWIHAFYSFSNSILLKRAGVVIVEDGKFTSQGMFVFSITYASTSFALACAFFYALKNLQRGD